METKRRKIAIALFVCFVFVLLASSWVMTAEFGHECCLENCPICSAITAAEKMTEKLSSSQSSGIISAPVFAVVLSLICVGLESKNTTLVSLKIKLTD